MHDRLATRTGFALPLTAVAWMLCAGCQPGIEADKTVEELTETTQTTQTIQTTETSFDSLCDGTADGVLMFDDTDVAFAPDAAVLTRHEFTDPGAEPPLQYQASLFEATAFGGSLLIQFGSGEPRAGLVYEDVVASGTSAYRPSVQRLYLGDGTDLEVLSGWVLYPQVGIEADDPHVMCFGLELEGGHSVSGVAAGPLQVVVHTPAPPGP